MKRDRLHRAARWRQTSFLHRLQALEEAHSGFDRVKPWRLEPLEREGIASPAEDVEHGRRQVNPMHVWFAVRAQLVVDVPEPPHDSRTCSPRPPGALVRGI